MRLETQPEVPADSRPTVDTIAPYGVFPNLEATTMAILPADEDYARAVLTIFRGSRVQAKQSLKSSHVKAEFLSHNLGRAFDYDAAVEYALEQGWVTLQLGAIRLTEVGFAEL